MDDMRAPPENRLPTTAITAVDSILFHIPTAYRQRLEFSYSKVRGQVAIKVIDRWTDTVIKELPPTEFQRAHITLREAIGHLPDAPV